jgi:hypothetical protein
MKECPVCKHEKSLNICRMALRAAKDDLRMGEFALLESLKHIKNLIDEVKFSRKLAGQLGPRSQECHEAEQFFKKAGWTIVGREKLEPKP